MNNKLMSAFIVLILTLASTKAHAAPGDEDELWTNDRQVHAAVSAGISAGMYLYLGNRKVRKKEKFWISLMSSIAIGALKEATDANPSENDLIANSAGALTGSLIMITIDW